MMGPSCRKAPARRSLVFRTVNCMEYFLCVLGMVMVLEGIPYFGFPEKMKQFMEFIQQQNDATLRIIGGALMFLGVVILFAARVGLRSQ